MIEEARIDCLISNIYHSHKKEYIDKCTWISAGNNKIKYAYEDKESLEFNTASDDKDLYITFLKNNPECLIRIYTYNIVSMETTHEVYSISELPKLLEDMD